LQLKATAYFVCGSLRPDDTLNVQPKVSILIPVYNRPEEIVRAVRSALAQTHQNLEIVVSDNASTDSTWSVVQRLAAEDLRVHAFRNATNIGPTRNWIAGLERCRGDYIKVLWSDDWIEATFVEDLLHPMHEQPDVSLAFCAALIHRAEWDEPPYYFCDQRWFTTVEYLRQSLMGHTMPVSPACALVRRDAARFRLPTAKNPRMHSIGERLGAGPDLLMLLDAAGASSRIAYIPKFLVHFCAGRTSITCVNPEEVQEGYRLTREYFVVEQAVHPAIRALKARLTARRWERAIKRELKRRCEKLAALPAAMIATVGQWRAARRS
jgi:glycosyltransferase involved in cell wall biosynthesis